MRDLTLSMRVQAFVETEDWESHHGLSPEELKEAKQASAIVKVIVDDVISSRETLTNNKLAAIEKLVESTPDLIEYFLDERFTRDLIDSVPGYVNRTLKLSRLQGSHIPSKITNGYLREAVRAYIMGLPQASVALSRAAMEQALKEGIGYQSSGTFIKMNDLLDEAESACVIDPDNRKFCRMVADEADNVLHEEPTSLDKAYDVLMVLRGIFQHIYGSV